MFCTYIEEGRGEGRGGLVTLCVYLGEQAEFLAHQSTNAWKHRLLAWALHHGLQNPSETTVNKGCLLKSSRLLCSVGFCSKPGFKNSLLRPIEEFTQAIQQRLCSSLYQKRALLLPSLSPQRSKIFCATAVLLKLHYLGLITETLERGSSLQIGGAALIV